MARAARFTTLIGALFVCTVCASAQTIDSISIYFAGDIMQHEAQLKAALRADGTYDYTGCFTQVTPEIEAADIAVCNFETTLGGAPYSGYPQFCSPDELAAAVRDAGFDIFLTANNHCLDRRTRGLVRTLDVLDSLGIPHLGTYRDLAERDSLYPYIIERNSMRIALLNYTYATNGIPVAAPCIVNYIDTTQIKADVIRARQLHADCIIACMHWGTEYRLEPDKSQKTLEEWLYSIGVDHIIGGHPHVVQPVRTLPHRYHAGSSLTVWSLGNYISNMSAPHTFQGLAVTTRLIKIGNITKLRGYDIHPNRTVRPDFIVVPDR
jgi:poly-gamma-glutamate synthesis protein (capsule biosynthesis protein)